MADKDTGRAKKLAKPASASTGSDVVRPGPERAAPVTIKSLEAERDALKTELEAAKTRIEALEAANSQVLNRLSWTIDALQALKDGVKP